MDNQYDRNFYPPRGGYANPAPWNNFWRVDFDPQRSLERGAQIIKASKEYAARPKPSAEEVKSRFKELRQNLYNCKSG